MWKNNITSVLLEFFFFLVRNRLCHLTFGFFVSMFVFLFFSFVFIFFFFFFRYLFLFRVVAIRNCEANFHTVFGESRNRKEKNKSNRKKMTSNAFKCSICLDQASPPAVVTRCGHLFCWSCLDAWAQQRGHRTVPCPVCSGAVDIDHETIPIYGAGEVKQQHPSQRNREQQQRTAPPAATASAAATAEQNGTQQTHQHHQHQQQQPQPPPQAHRRAEPAPPPVNNHNNQRQQGFFANPFRGAGGFGLGGFPLMFMWFGGGGSGLGGVEYIISTVLFLFGIACFALTVYGNMRGVDAANNNQHQQQQHYQNNVWGRFARNFDRARQRGKEFFARVWNFLRQYATAIAWVVAVLMLLAGSGWIDLSFLQPSWGSPPSLRAAGRYRRSFRIF